MYATVYRAELMAETHPLHQPPKGMKVGQTVALKRMAKSEVAKNKKVKQAKMEMRMCDPNFVNHPNIVKVWDSWEDQQPEGNYYFVFEILEGGMLFDKIQEIGPMEVDVVRFMMAELFAGLNYLHKDLGILHRDLKPENIMLDSMGHCKIIDFGSAAKMDDSDGVIEESKASYVTGTAKYMSPELLKEDKDPNKGSSDVWALGVTAYQLLTTRTPFRGQGEYHIWEAIKNVSYEWVPGVDPVAMDFVNAIFNTEFEERLGCQANGSSDIGALSTHPFFILNGAPMDIFKCHIKSPPPMRRNMSVEWKPPRMQAMEEEGPQLPPRSAPYRSIDPKRLQDSLKNTDYYHVCACVIA